MRKSANEFSSGTKTMMVEAAIKLFKERGVEEVNVKDICDYCNVTRNCFYYYFVSKERLFDSIGDYISALSKTRINTVLEDNSYYNQIWEYYRAYLLTEIEMGPAIMNHCCISRTGKGLADKFSYIDERIERDMLKLISYAKRAGEISSPVDDHDLLWVSYAMVRGVNIKWCFQWGESDLLGEAAIGMDAIFLPAADKALAGKYAK